MLLHHQYANIGYINNKSAILVILLPVVQDLYCKDYLTLLKINQTNQDPKVI